MRRSPSLRSPPLLRADIIVTATGFDSSALGDIAFAIEGKPLDFHETVAYRGMMFTGVPNLLWVFGYFRELDTARGAPLRFRLSPPSPHGGSEVTRVSGALRPEDTGMPLLDRDDRDAE